MKQEPERHKLARALYSELQDIWKSQRKLGFHKLSKPVQKGWKAQFRIRADILRSSWAHAYLAIMPHIQKSQISRTTTFKYLHELELGSIPEKKREKTILPEYYWDKFFILKPDPRHGYRTGVEYICPQAYFISHPFRFEIEIIPYYVSYLRIIDPALESREKELRNRLEKHDLYKIIHKNMGWYGYDDRDDIRQKELLREMESEVRKELGR